MRCSPMRRHSQAQCTLSPLCNPLTWPAALPIVPELVLSSVPSDTTAYKWFYALRLLRLARVFRLLRGARPAAGLSVCVQRHQGVSTAALLPCGCAHTTRFPCSCCSLGRLGLHQHLGTVRQPLRTVPFLAPCVGQQGTLSAEQRTLCASPPSRRPDVALRRGLQRFMSTAVLYFCNLLAALSILVNLMASTWLGHSCASQRVCSAGAACGQKPPHMWRHAQQGSS